MYITRAALETTPELIPETAYSTLLLRNLIESSLYYDHVHAYVEGLVLLDICVY